MAVNVKDILEFEEMFNLSPNEDGSNEQTEEYGHSTESSEPFNDLAKEVSEKIEQSDAKGTNISKEDPHDIVKDVCNEEVVRPISQLEVCPEPKSSAPEDDMFNEFDAPEAEEGPPLDEENKREVPSGESPVAVYAEAQIGAGDDKIEWMLSSPSAMYNSFYAKKRDLLFKYMVGGQVEYKRWTDELAEAKVVIRGEVFDHQLIINQMEAVQQHRERVKYIHVRVNNQYFTFKIFIGMMRGFLARIEYLKPVVRQEGLIMEHMRDLELYYARLESLHDSATKTEKMLAAAFETLSRKCTICMELRPAERVDKESSSTYVPREERSIPVVREHTSEFDEFDDLPSNAQAAPVGHKVGAIGWGDI